MKASDVAWPVPSTVTGLPTWVSPVVQSGGPLKGTFSEIVDAAKGGMLGTFKAQPGFVRYGLADTGEGDRDRRPGGTH